MPTPRAPWALALSVLLGGCQAPVVGPAAPAHARAVAAKRAPNPHALPETVRIALPAVLAAPRYQVFQAAEGAPSAEPTLAMFLRDQLRTYDDMTAQIDRFLAMARQGGLEPGVPREVIDPEGRHRAVLLLTTYADHGRLDVAVGAMGGADVAPVLRMDFAGPRRGRAVFRPAADDPAYADKRASIAVDFDLAAGVVACTCAEVGPDHRVLAHQEVRRNVNPGAGPAVMQVIGGVRAYGPTPERSGVAGTIARVLPDGRGTAFIAMANAGTGGELAFAPERFMDDHGLDVAREQAGSNVLAIVPPREVAAGAIPAAFDGDPLADAAFALPE